MKLPLAYYGDPILRQKGSPVTAFNEELRQFVHDMIETMHAYNGVGLSAHQVHRAINVFITEMPLPNPDAHEGDVEEKKWLPGKLRIFINPKILSYSDEQYVYSEGCLSIPKLYAHVVRPKSIHIEAQDLHGHTFEEELHLHEADVFMHENDHINGVLFIDRIHGKERKDLDPILRAIKKKYNVKK